jgi:hypothetical protein
LDGDSIQDIGHEATNELLAIFPSKNVPGINEFVFTSDPDGNLV